MPAKGYRKEKVKVTETDVSFLKPVDLSFIGHVVFSGHGFRISVPMKQVNFWNIKTGDEVLVRISQIKRYEKQRPEETVNTN